MAEFDYYSTRGEKTRRRIEPIQLLFKSKAWYVTGFCLSRQAMRLFKLTRVKNLIITRKHFSEREPIKPGPDTGFFEPQMPLINLKLKIHPKMTYLVFDEFGEDMVKKQADGSFVVSAALPEDDWVYGFILSFGEYIEVLGPPHIKRIIKRKARKIYNKYI